VIFGVIFELKHKFFSWVFTFAVDILIVMIRKLNGICLRLFRIFGVLIIVTDMNIRKANLGIFLVILN